MARSPCKSFSVLDGAWTTQDRYLFAGAGGDQLTGRVLSGLPFNDSAFASLPSHFDQEGVRLIAWESILPLHSRLPHTFKQALPYLLASVCYHERWLRLTLPVQHPLFASHLFASGTVQSLQRHLLTGCSRCPVTGMMATGIPPHLVMSNGLTDVVKETQLLKEKLLSRCAELPAELTSTMLSKFSIGGAIPLTADDMRVMLNGVVAQVRAELRQVHAPETRASVATVDPSVDPRFQLWSWGGRLHMVPQGWLFPSTNIKDTWNLWHFGHLADKIRPLRCLKKFDLVGAAQITLWAKTSGVMKAMSHTMIDMKLVETKEVVLTLAAADSSALFDRAVVQLMEQVRPRSTQERGRWMEMSMPTWYAYVQRCRKRKRKREDGEAEEAEVAV